MPLRVSAEVKTGQLISTRILGSFFPYANIGPREWTETHEPWHEEILDRGDRKTRVVVFGRETRIADGFRYERLYIKGLRVDLGNEAPNPLSGIRETIVLQEVRLKAPKFSPDEMVMEALRPEEPIDTRELVGVG